MLKMRQKQENFFLLIGNTPISVVCTWQLVCGAEQTCPKCSLMKNADAFAIYCFNSDWQFE